MGTFSIWSGLVVWAVLLLIVVPLYFLPAIVAFKRRHRNRLAILALNIVLGFTGIGWAVAIVWAFTADIESEGGAGETSSNRQRPRVPPTL